jgi:hypothetical protein
VRIGRYRIVQAPWWAWVLLALLPTAGYLLAEAIIHARNG